MIEENIKEGLWKPVQHNVNGTTTACHVFHHFGESILKVVRGEPFFRQTEWIFFITEVCCIIL